MSTNIMGLSTNEIRSSWDLELNRSKEGLWTGAQTYHCPYVDHANVAITSKIKKGQKLTDLDSNIPIKYDFLTIDSHKISHQRGGITKIRLTFKGADLGDGLSSGIDERSVSYSFRGLFRQKPIIEHPNYLAEVISESNRVPIAAYYYGEATAERVSSTVYRILRKVDDWDYASGNITDTDAIKWLDKIHVKGVRTYDDPMAEWTVTETNKGGMTQTELDDFGKKITTPPGNPITPTWFTGSNGWWQFSDISEDKDENSSVFSRTYTLKNEEVDSDIYDY